MTTEYLAQMLPMLVLAGAMAGLVAQVPKTTRGYGLLPDMGIGVVGSILAGAFLRATTASGPSMTGMFLIGAVGAALALVVQRRVWSAPQRKATARAWNPTVSS